KSLSASQGLTGDSGVGTVSPSARLYSQSYPSIYSSGAVVGQVWPQPGEGERERERDGGGGKEGGRGREGGKERWRGREEERGECESERDRERVKKVR